MQFGTSTLAAVSRVAKDPVSGLLLVAPALACGFAFRGYMAQREQREHVEFLYESMRATQSAPDFSQAIGRLLAPWAPKDTGTGLF